MSTAAAAPFMPMEAKIVAELPDGEGWQYEPKWDGFRAIAVRDGASVALWSRAGKPLGRYFPEVLAALAATKEQRFILDGELILPAGDVLSFSALQARLHPAESRIERLSRETPAQLMLFDLLGRGDDTFTEAPLAERRCALEAFHAREGSAALLLSPASPDVAQARRWLAASGGALDGVVAKRLDEAYQPGERAMVKVKQHRSADCVVGGFRESTAGRAVGSLLLGLYDASGLLNHVGFTSGFAEAERRALLKELTPLVEPPGFTGRAPGGPSRWATERSTQWRPLRPERVVEVLYDQVTAGRFRHGTRFLRWRPDKTPAQCTEDQLVHELRPAELAALVKDEAS
ncbi:MAG: ATP-dependent DNA ligase [Pararhizobium sp.]